MLTTINRKRLFTLEEARELLPLIKRLTQKAVDETEGHLTQLEYLSQDSSNRKEISDELNHFVNRWVEKVQKLGCEVKGLWLVDFDSGEGDYWCWQYPESDVEFYHSHNEGFSARKPIPIGELGILATPPKTEINPSL